MKYGEGDGGNHDHGTFKNLEQNLVVGKSAIETLGQLGHAVHGASEDGERGYYERCLFRTWLAQPCN